MGRVAAVRLWPPMEAPCGEVIAIDFCTRQYLIFLVKKPRRGNYLNAIFNHTDEPLPLGTSTGACKRWKKFTRTTAAAPPRPTRC
jgi:hypothetical protein